MKIIPDSYTPNEAWEKFCACSPLDTVEAPLRLALDHCLAEDFFTSENVPVAPRSFMDGFAVRAQDVRNVPVKLKSTAEILMGTIPEKPLSDQMTMAIPTGGFLPAGADAVVMQEDTTTDNEWIIVYKSVEPGENVQQPAEDFEKGSLLFPKHHRLRPQDISSIATFGTADVTVFRKPRLAIVSTGDELVPFETSQQAGKIRETNALALATAAEKFGFPAESLGIFPDDLQSQIQAMNKGLSIAEVVLVSGGSSVGARDFTADAIRSFDPHRIYFHGLAIRPGAPTIFASARDRYVFGLPGQPVSSLIVFYHFVLPFLCHLAGERIDYSSFAESRFSSRTARLAGGVKPLTAKTDYLRVRLERTGEGWNAIPVPGKSASLSTLAKADGYVILPPGKDPVPKGTLLKVHLFP